MHRIGIIPFGIEGDAMALLFVTSQTRGRWILPKGRQKRGETHAEACHREGFEEAGVRGVVLEDFPLTVPIGRQTPNGIEIIPVTYYPYLVVREDDDWPERKQRERLWVLIDDAEDVAFDEDLLALIHQFQALATWITNAAKGHVKLKRRKPVRVLATKTATSRARTRRRTRPA
jgi:8-oxo-dGTP pyrophosphatase MutT (NUDIX family)